MAIANDNQVIKRVLVVDDAEASRASLGEIVKDTCFLPVLEDGPIFNLIDFVSSFPGKADAALCDYKLRVRPYSAFNGDVIVAELFKHKIPGILCTSYPDVVDMMDRRNLRYIPSLLKTGNPNPDEIVEAYSFCIEEIGGKIRHSRKAWRNLVRVEERCHDDRAIYVTVPGWDRNRKVLLHLDSLPPELHDSIKAGTRLHAKVNIGAESDEELYFDEWEAE